MVADRRPYRVPLPRQQRPPRCRDDSRGRDRLVEITATGNARSVILRPHWSPDGSFLAYGKAKVTNNFSGGQGFGTADIFTIPSGGGSAAEITPAGFDAPILMGWR